MAVPAVNERRAASASAGRSASAKRASVPACSPYAYSVRTDVVASSTMLPASAFSAVLVMPDSSFICTMPTAAISGKMASTSSAAERGGAVRRVRRGA